MIDASAQLRAAARAGRRNFAHHRHRRASVNRASAMRAYERRMRLVAALAMEQFYRRPTLARHPPVAPSEHRNQDRIEVESLCREPILDVIAGRSIFDTFENSVTDQGSEPRAQDIARDSGTRLEFVETAPAQKSLAQDKHRPSLTHDRKRPRNRAICLADRFPTHLSFLVLSARGPLKSGFDAAFRRIAAFYSCISKPAALGLETAIPRRFEAADVSCENPSCARHRGRAATMNGIRAGEESESNPIRQARRSRGPETG